jgi:hypothetical protein
MTNEAAKTRREARLRTPSDLGENAIKYLP